jgi:glyoxylase-like metal-dependent hydrolase (beta-lactamase superfamily II)
MSDEIRLYLFEGGLVHLPLRNFTMGAGLGGEMITTPVIWFLLTHPRGNVIIDGGNAAEAAVDVKAHWGAITEMSSLAMTPEQAVVPTLERLGVEPASIRWIVQSHLHLDHTGAVAAIDSFPNAQVLVTRTEYEFGHAPDSYTALGYCQADYVKPGIDWVLLEESDDGWDLFGDGTLRCWRTPGHSPGHQSFEVRLPSGQAFVLAVDAANALDHLEERALPGFLVSAVDTVRSVRKLRRIAWRAQATVVAGHDPEQWPALKQAPDYYD